MALLILYFLVAKKIPVAIATLKRFRWNPLRMKSFSCRNHKTKKSLFGEWSKQKILVAFTRKE